jgi:hypothetical protein
MTEDVPQWALDRVAALCLVTRDQIAAFPWLRIFARYIAEHEEPPVDPLETLAKELADVWRKGPPAKGEVLALAALRRGIELGKESK